MRVPIRPDADGIRAVLLGGTVAAFALLVALELGAILGGAWLLVAVALARVASGAIAADRPEAAARPAARRLTATPERAPR